MRRSAAIVLVFLALGLALWRLTHRSAGNVQPLQQESPLYTGKEQKLKVRLCFPSTERSGFVEEGAEIYLTASKGAQVKQLLQHLFHGPKGPGAAPAFPQGFSYREVFVTEKGLAVVDLDPDSVKSLPGGTSSEFVSLYCLVRTLTENFKDLKQVQLLVGGESRESLAGHFDISGPLTLEDF
jgi:germination protein M